MILFCDCLLSGLMGLNWTDGRTDNRRMTPFPNAPPWRGRAIFYTTSCRYSH